PPAKNFWSVIVYDTQTRSMLQTDQQFPTKGSHSAGIEKNADGSYDLYFGPRRQPVKKATGFRPFPAEDGSRSFASTARWSRGSTKRGGRANSSCRSKCVKVEMGPLRSSGRAIWC